MSDGYASTVKATTAGNVAGLSSPKMVKVKQAKAKSTLAHFAPKKK